VKGRRAVLAVGALLALASIAAAGGKVTDLARSIPLRILDWPATGADRVYDSRTLYDYLDGGAEVYLAFDFREAFVRRYRSPSGEEIALDIYELGSSAEAFGVFSCDRQDPEAGIGQESEYGPGLLRFWQGRYFVALTASGDEQAAEAPILALGRAVAPLLGPDGERPQLLERLPRNGLKPDRTCYFHAPVSLNNRFFVSADNILRLDKTTDCALAEYDSGSAENARLLLVRYPDPGSAAEAERTFRRSYLPEAGESGAAATENGTWVLVRRRFAFLTVVFEAPSEAFAAGLESAVRYPTE
jgi:hypothetical protein